MQPKKERGGGLIQSKQVVLVSLKQAGCAPMLQRMQWNSIISTEEQWKRVQGGGASDFTIESAGTCLSPFRCSVDLLWTLFCIDLLLNALHSLCVNLKKTGLNLS